MEKWWTILYELLNNTQGIMQSFTICLCMDIFK
jgi:hypothetical protein